jgi:hypothetical protein
MYLHAAILKIAEKGYVSYDDIYWGLHAIGWEGNTMTSGWETRVLAERFQLKNTDYQNKKNGGTHRRFIKARLKKTRIKK